MALESPVLEPVFSRDLIARVSGSVAETVSREFVSRGNTAVLSCTLVASKGLSSSDPVDVVIEGSYDGRSWVSTGATVKFDADGLRETSSSPLSGCDYFSLRVRATIGGTTSGVAALLDASVVLSHQA